VEFGHKAYLWCGWPVMFIYATSNCGHKLQSMSLARNLHNANELLPPGIWNRVDLRPIIPLRKF